jgi:hypothetical protein
LPDSVLVCGYLGGDSVSAAGGVFSSAAVGAGAQAVCMGAGRLSQPAAPHPANSRKRLMKRRWDGEWIVFCDGMNAS